MSLLNPPEVQIVRAYLMCLTGRVKTHTKGYRSQRGASLVEWVVIAGLVVAAAILIVGIVVAKMKKKAEDIPTE